MNFLYKIMFSTYCLEITLGITGLVPRVGPFSNPKKFYLNPSTLLDFLNGINKFLHLKLVRPMLLLAGPSYNKLKLIIFWSTLINWKLFSGPNNKKKEFETNNKGNILKLNWFGLIEFISLIKKFKKLDIWKLCSFDL